MDVIGLLVHCHLCQTLYGVPGTLEFLLYIPQPVILTFFKVTVVTHSWNWD